MSITSEQNAIIDAGTSFFIETLHNAGALAWSEIEPFLNTLELDSNNHVAQTPYNNDVGNEISIAIMHGAQSPDYAVGLEEIKNTVDELADAAREYYASKDIYLQTTSYNYDRMLKGLQTTIKNDLDAAFGAEAYQSKIMQPALTAYYQHHVGQGSTLNATLTDMQHRIEDRFINFAVTPLATIMQQYTRRLHEIFAIHGTSDLIWVVYNGVDDDRNRDFCDHYLQQSKYFHVDEVKKWPEEWGNDWPGMIPGTDQNSIFVNAGGFNCRHNYEYVTQREVEENEPLSIARAKTKGLAIYYRNEN